MDESAHTQDPQAPSGRVYRIMVQGRLEPSWSERVAGMKIMPVENDGSEKGRTMLVGPVQDQAELTGVLNTLYGLHLPLLSVEAEELGDTMS